MGVSGGGLKSNGLHKIFLNGSQADHNGASEKTRTGGGVTDKNLKATGLHKQYVGNGSPQETKSPIRKVTPTRINGQEC